MQGMRKGVASVEKRIDWVSAALTAGARVSQILTKNLPQHIYIKIKKTTFKLGKHKTEIYEY